MCFVWKNRVSSATNPYIQLVNPRTRYDHHQQKRQANAHKRNSVRPHLSGFSCTPADCLPLYHRWSLLVSHHKESARAASRTLRPRSSITEQELRPFWNVGNTGIEPDWHDSAMKRRNEWIWTISELDRMTVLSSMCCQHIRIALKKKKQTSRGVSLV